MAECKSESEIMPYRFEPMSVLRYSDDESDSSESETDISRQASQSD